MATEVSTSAPGLSAAPSRSGDGVLLSLVLLLLAVAVVGAAVYYVVGVDDVTSLLGMGSAPGSGGTTPAAVPATSTPVVVSQTELLLPPGVTPELAKRMYVEQIQSQADLNRMASGEITRFEVDSVKVTAGKAAVLVTAHFSDGTSAPGVIQLVKCGGSWYFMSITAPNAAGYRTGGVGGWGSRASEREERCAGGQRLRGDRLRLWGHQYDARSAVRESDHHHQYR